MAEDLAEDLAEGSVEDLAEDSVEGSVEGSVDINLLPICLLLRMEVHLAGFLTRVMECREE